MSKTVFSRPSASAVSSLGGLSPTVRWSPLSASYNLCRLSESCRNVASSAICLPAGQCLVKVFGQNFRPRQAALKRQPYRADQKALGNDSRVHTRRQTLRSFFNHLLFLGAEVQHVEQAPVAQGTVRLKTHRVHRNRTRLVERLHHGRWYVS